MSATSHNCKRLLRVTARLSKGRAYDFVGGGCIGPRVDRVVRGARRGRTASPGILRDVRCRRRGRRCGSRRRRAHRPSCHRSSSPSACRRPVWCSYVRTSVRPFTDAGPGTAIRGVHGGLIGARGLTVDEVQRRRQRPRSPARRDMARSDRRWISDTAFDCRDRHERRRHNV